MRRIAAILLCIAMCLTMVPWVAHAEGTVQYAAVTATEPDWSDASVVTGYTNANDAKDEQDCVAVVVYSLDAAPGDPADVAGDLQLHGRTVILSNVAVSGTVYCDELYLLGESSVSPDASYVITGTSAGGSPKEALTEVANGPADGLIPAVDGAEIRCTVTGSTTTSSGAQGHEMVVEQDGFLSVDTLLEVRDMVVEEGGTVCITGGAYTNELIIQNSLSVSGTVTADNGQWLTLRPNATVSGDGLTLYQEDGVTPFTPPSEHGELTFEWNGTCWRAMGGGGGEPGGGDPGPGGSAGALTGMNTEDPDHYVVSSDCTVSPESSVDLSMCSITVTAEGTLRVEAGARVDLRGVVFTNYGEIIIDPAADSLDHGRIEVRDDRYPDEEVTHGKLENHGTITVDGNLEIDDGAQIVNTEDASIVVGNFLRLSGGAQLTNSGSVTGSEGGRIELFVDDGPDAEPLIVSDLNFYDSPEDAASDDPTEELRGLFYYDSDAEKWIRSEGSGGDGGDPGGEGPRPWQIYTDFGIHGWVDGPRDVDDGGEATFILTPDEGFVVGPVTVSRQATGTPWESVGPLTDEGDGTRSIVVMNVTEDLILSVTFVSETPPTVDSILQKSYAILVADAGSTEAVEAALRGEIDGLGYVDGYSVTVTDVDLPGDGEDYGTFRFTLTVDEATSPQTTGYIVREPSNILFKVVGEHEGLEVNEVLMADSDDAQLGVFELPAMDSGSIEVVGAYSAGIEGWMSPDVADGALAAGSGRYRIIANQPFYRLQMHIANRPANPADEANWFGFDVIQADAYCVWVDESSGAGRQRTLQWELNRYAQLTTGDYTSLVFFGNDLFTLSLPPNGLGGVTEFSVPTGTFQGYTVSHNEDDTYTVEFLSDFYDRITLEVTINGSVTRELHIHRVGVEIDAFDLHGENRPGQVFHGTQYGSKVHYDDGTAYHIFATYCIPDGEDVPYGLYVTFTWADGSTTTEIIGAPYDPHKDPEDSVAHLFDSDRGVFVYPEHADPADYLIYEAPTSAGAPVKVNVLVLKDEPDTSGSFGGVFFGSGVGVQWQAD
jgi:hypothetical protein